MLEQAAHFRRESLALFDLVRDLPAHLLDKPTLFKGWTIVDIIRHLHMWNWAVIMSLDEPAEFSVAVDRWKKFHKKNDIRIVERDKFGHLVGRSMLIEWRDYMLQVADRFSREDPSRRVEWAGPTMSVRMSITARLMETWAHAQAVYDLRGVVRNDSEYIRDIAHIGVSTFGWTFANRSLPPPGEVPHVRLTSPSGERWLWNTPNEENLVEGDATEFCQVVCQTRNVQDTRLKVVGAPAIEWMRVAQCFAGPPRDPPLPGARHRVEDRQDHTDGTRQQDGAPGSTGSGSSR